MRITNGRLNTKQLHSEDTLFSPTNHVYLNLNRDNNVVDNHRISSNQLDMYVLDERNIVTGDILDLHEVFEDNKIKLSDIFTSQHAQLSQQMTRFGGLDDPFTVGEHKMYSENHIYVRSIQICLMLCSLLLTSLMSGIVHLIFINHILALH